MYKKKAKCLLNTSKLYRRQFEHNIIPIKDRKYDVAFCGRMDYDPLIALHRKDIFDAIKNLEQKYNLNVFVSNKVSLKEYYNIIKNCKIFVSPWGYGEWSLKEFECICVGCHVFIPDGNYMMYPNYYENFGNFKVDMSDFDKKILEGLNDDNIQNLVNKNRQLFWNFNLNNTKEEIEKLLIKY